MIMIEFFSGWNRLKTIKSIQKLDNDKFFQKKCT